jgi:hypothetical protein
MCESERERERDGETEGKRRREGKTKNRLLEEQNCEQLSLCLSLLL